MRGNNYQGEFVECDKCKAKQRAENYRFEIATSRFEPVMWECHYCKAMNPNDVFRCRTCFKSLV